MQRPEPLTHVEPPQEVLLPCYAPAGAQPWDHAFRHASCWPIYPVSWASGPRVPGPSSRCFQSAFPTVMISPLSGGTYAAGLGRPWVSTHILRCLAQAPGEPGPPAQTPCLIHCFSEVQPQGLGLCPRHMPRLWGKPGGGIYLLGLKPEAYGFYFMCSGPGPGAPGAEPHPCPTLSCGFLGALHHAPLPASTEFALLLSEECMRGSGKGGRAGQVPSSQG